MARVYQWRARVLVPLCPDFSGSGPLLVMSFVLPVKDSRMDYQLPPLQQAQIGVGVGLNVGIATHQMPPVVGLPPNVPHMPPGTNPIGQDDTGRWTQYQQLWRQHVYMNGMHHLTFLFAFIYLLLRRANNASCEE